MTATKPKHAPLAYLRQDLLAQELAAETGLPVTAGKLARLNSLGGGPPFSGPDPADASYRYVDVQAWLAGHTPNQLKALLK